ncbi:MAG: hypothetical protein WAX89_06085 [Alphaproteobacteria bacterium]
MEHALFMPENYPLHSWVQLQAPRDWIATIEDLLDWLLGVGEVEEVV